MGRIVAACAHCGRRSGSSRSSSAASRPTGALFEAVDDEFLAQAQIRSVHSEFIELLEQLLARGRTAGSVRPEVGALDVLLLVKGMCAAAAALDAAPDLIDRQDDLIGAAISTPEHAVRLRGRAPTLPDFEAAAAARAVTPLR